jgi:putative thiamine transport system substrate-binding protein
VAHAAADAPLLLAQALMELAPRRAALARPATDAAYAAQSAPMWDWYARLRPHLFRHGDDLVRDSLALALLLRGGDLDLYIATNPGEAAYGIAHGMLPRTARASVPEAGPAGDSAFLMLLRDAWHPEAAMLLADFLLSPEAQAHAENPAFLGCPTVLASDRLPPAPHPTWLARVTADWSRRVTR